MRKNPKFVVALALIAACASGSDPHLYATAREAPGFTDAEISGLQRLGATQIGTGVNFSVYSQHATRVDLALFDKPTDSRPAQQFPMVRIGDVWNLYVDGVGYGANYGYIAWGPNWPHDDAWYPGSIAGFVADVDEAGNRYNPNKLLIDPYARAFSGDYNWSASPASGPDRTVSNYASQSKSVVVRSQYAWSNAETAWRAARASGDHPGFNANEMVIYEVHPKGYTASPASGVNHPGTFRGIGEKADYFKDLGINAVELMPAQQKTPDGGYWGYETIGFFAPELTFSSDTRPYMVGDEFKWMVDQLHQRGVMVLMDVVYNHTGEGGLWRDKIAVDGSPDPGNLANYDPKEVASVLGFRGLDNQSYYALSRDNQTYWDNTGVGNDSRCNNTPMRQMILDSLHYWVTEMHVDGFRFDLAPILAEQDGNYNSFDPTHSVIQDIADDPILLKYHVPVIAEPWSVYGAFVGQFPKSTVEAGAGWSEWNGPFRDWWRSFINYDGTNNTQYWNLNTQQAGATAGSLLTGSYAWYHGTGREPYNSVNFTTVHDGFTMYDLFSYDSKQNGCGPLDTICCTQPTSSFCTAMDGTDDNRSRNWHSEDLKRANMRAMFTAMMIAQGTPMILGGDEWMRTQLGNNNAYSNWADNAYNWFDWGAWQPDAPRNRMHDFVRQLIKFRRAHEYAFAPADWDHIASFAWENAGGGAQAGNDWNTKHLALHYNSSSQGPQLDVLINMETTQQTFTLPAGVAWTRIVDTQAAFDEPTYFTSDMDSTLSANIFTASPTPVTGSYGVAAKSIVILEEAR
jgi:isoamylase